MAYSALRKECIRLRVQERLSYSEIYERTGAPKGTLSNWLEHLSLSSEEKAEKQRQARRPTGPRVVLTGSDRLHSTAKKHGIGSSPAVLGRVSEAAVLLRLAVLGLEPYTGVFGGENFDGVVWHPGKPGKLARIQVRTAGTAKKHGLPYVSLRKSDGRRNYKKYERGDLDFMLAYHLPVDTVYVFTRKELGKRTVISVNEDVAEDWGKVVSWF
ncbi:hypothetical protein LCGC14_0331910 [marine sediment metagenome]|uniref:PD(D/E)XK endonuclease domain-containing protein n=1 Tax=marine sediment metagenome TaxID=412755 RepID=A0A0F9TZ04_9ZZZZ